MATVEAINKRWEVAGKDPSRCPKWREVRETMIELGHPVRTKDVLKKKYTHCCNPERELERVRQVDYSIEELIRIKQLKENPSEADKKAMGEVTGGNLWYKITQITNREFNVVRFSGNVATLYGRKPVLRLK